MFSLRMQIYLGGGGGCVVCCFVVSFFFSLSLFLSSSNLIAACPLVVLQNNTIDFTKRHRKEPPCEGKKAGKKDHPTVMTVKKKNSYQKDD